jgi:hypothetical protein
LVEKRSNRRLLVKKTLFGAAAAFALATAAFVGSAEAQCWWTGLGYSCAAPPATAPMYYQDPAREATPYPAWNSYDYQDYRARPLWLPSYPGPRPG